MKHHKTLRRGFSVLLSLMLCLTMLPTVTLTAAAADDHTHCICGSKVAECGDEEDIEWTAWESSDSLPDTKGYYYLTKDVSLTETLEMSRNVQSGNTQNLKSSAAPVRLPAAPAPTLCTSQAAAQAGCAYRS